MALHLTIYEKTVKLFEDYLEKTGPEAVPAAVAVRQLHNDFNFVARSLKQEPSVFANVLEDLAGKRYTLNHWLREIGFEHIVPGFKPPKEPEPETFFLLTERWLAEGLRGGVVKRPSYAVSGPYDTRQAAQAAIGPALSGGCTSAFVVPLSYVREAAESEEKTGMVVNACGLALAILNIPFKQKRTNNDG